MPLDAELERHASLAQWLTNERLRSRAEWLDAVRFRESQPNDSGRRGAWELEGLARERLETWEYLAMEYAAILTRMVATLTGSIDTDPQITRCVRCGTGPGLNHGPDAFVRSGKNILFADPLPGENNHD